MFQTKPFQRVYLSLARLHDLWILLAWAGIITAVMLNTFYHRNCYEFTAERDVTAPCQSLLAWALFFFAAVGAGMAVTDERAGFLGFIIAHLTATVLFVTVIVFPFLLGVTDTSLLNVTLSQSIVLALKSQFPFAVFFSFIGAILGLYFGGKIGG